jgi:hypothetical protein
MIIFMLIAIMSNKYQPSKYLVDNDILFLDFFLNSFIGTVFNWMRSRFTYNISLGVCLWFCRLDVCLQLGCIGAVPIDEFVIVGLSQ